MSRTGSFRVTAVLKPRLSACRSPDLVPAQVVMELAVIHNEQGVVRPKQLEEVQAQTEWKAKALENLVTWSGSLPPLLPVTLHRMGGASYPGGLPSDGGGVLMAGRGMDSLAAPAAVGGSSPSLPRGSDGAEGLALRIHLEVVVTLTEDHLAA